MEIVTRAEWGARSPKRSLITVKMEGETTLHWNGPDVRVGGKLVWDHSACTHLVRGIQDYHMDGNGWNDIGYNFVVCPHRYIFEGRGINKINAANGTTNGNRTCHGVMNLAGPNNPFENEEKLGVVDCVTYISRKSGAPNSCQGHRDHKSTSCPGDTRYAWLTSGMPVKGSVYKPPTNPNPIYSDEELDEMVIIQHPSGAAVAVIPTKPLLGIKSEQTLENFRERGIPVVPVEDATWQEWHNKLD